jgi:V-type H+-transporting ATPase proteolipid subunit
MGEAGLLAPVYWVWAPVVLAWTCFIISVGDPTRFIDYDWLWFLFRHISPYFWASLGAALALAMSILGASW